MSAADFHTNTNRIGVIDLNVAGAGGAPVTYYECVGGRTLPLGRLAQNAETTSLVAATTWRCDRLVRHFAVTAITPAGTALRGLASVRTPSCAGRFVVTAPRTAQRGRAVTVRIVDRWRSGGITTRLCATAPKTRRTCRPVRFGPGTAAATRQLRPTVNGDWTVELQVRGYRVRAVIAVGGRAIAAAALPSLLATGDSTMQGVESALADDVAGVATVTPDVRPGFALSNLDWGAVAGTQVSRLHPRLVVYSLGAVEGYPMTTRAGTVEPCCGPGWTVEYARRVREVLVRYRQAGRARVYALTIPAPKAADRASITAAVDRAIVAACAGLPGVTALRMDRLFTPYGYQETIRDRGRTVAVRDPDGVHLSAAGTTIEARVVAAAVRADLTRSARRAGRAILGV